MRPEPHDVMMDNKATEFYAKVDLIEGALAEFGHYECPHCQTYIGLDRYVSREDIEGWLKAKGGK